MRYFVRVGDEELEVILDGEDVRVGDRTWTARVSEVDGTPVRLLTVGDEVHRVVVRPGASRDDGYLHGRRHPPD